MYVRGLEARGGLDGSTRVAVLAPLTYAMRQSSVSNLLTRGIIAPSRLSIDRPYVAAR